LDNEGRRKQMSDLIVIGYDNLQTARQAYEQVQRLQQDFVVELRGLAIVDVDADGKTHVDTPQRIIGTSAAHGALFGLLLGLLFFVPGHGPAWRRNRRADGHVHQIGH
jgi:uncharacterized membrane protein